MSALPVHEPQWDVWESEILNHKKKTPLDVAKIYLKALWGDKFALVAALVLLAVIVLCIAAPWVSPYSAGKGSLMDGMLEIGSKGHPLGTDSLGRDIFARLLYGTRVSLRIAAVVVAVSGLAGTVLGLLAGYYGRWVDQLIMRVLDIQLAFPGTLVALTFVLVLGAGERNLILALAFNGWMVYARLVRSLVMSMRDGPLVEAARALGLRSRHIIFRHIFPNVLSPMINLYVLELARIILAESVLSFLGFGIQPPQSSWGLMIAEGRPYVTTDPRLVLIPGLAIGVVVLALNIVATWYLTASDPVFKKAVQQAQQRRAVNT